MPACARTLKLAVTLWLTLGCAPVLEATALPGATAAQGVQSSPAPRLSGPAAGRVEGAQAVPSQAAAEANDRPEPALRPPIVCAPADWSALALPPLLRVGKQPNLSYVDQAGALQEGVFDEWCTDSPGPISGQAPGPTEVDGVEIVLSEARPAGTSARGWAGNRCAFRLKRADSDDAVTVLGQQQIPPFNTITAVVRRGSAVWVSVGFNGYTAEFPQGGNRIIALDLCAGRVVWQSNDSTSNGGLLLLGDYLLSAFGFTGERRYVYVFDAHSGAVLQKLPVVENQCPSPTWAPHWRPGQRCDAPGQRVGAAQRPRVEGGLFWVDTNTGSSSFQLE